MNAGLNPTITLTGSNWGAQVDVGWTTTTNPDDTFTATFLHDGTAETIPAEVATVSATSGGKDVAGNDDLGDASPSFVVDTDIATAPTSVSFTAVGGTVVADTLNLTNTNFTASATIVDGDAVGGSAELLIDGASFATPISLPITTCLPR